MNKFDPGKIHKTPTVRDVLPMREVDKAIDRHVSGDWGEVSDGDKRLNDEAVERGGRVWSSYTAMYGTRFWVITDLGNGKPPTTTVILPQEW